MNIKRLLTAIIGLPIVILLIIFGNSYIMDILIGIIAIIAMNEYARCIKKEAKFISWLRVFVSSWYYVYAYCIT